MSLSNFLASERSQSLRSATKITASLLLLAALAVTACSGPSTTSFVQVPPPPPPGQPALGTVSTAGNSPYSCPTGWYTYNDGAVPMACLNATINCPNTDAIGLTFGWLNPAGIIANVSAAKGVIVMFNGGGGGPLPGNFNFADNYFNAGYEVVQIAWAANEDWEQTYFTFSSGDTASIQTAACRPATFLNYIYTNSAYYPAVLSTNSQAGMCAHGLSAGSAAIAYSLAYYGAYQWLDNVELISGPVLSDLEQGCEYPNANPVTVCGQTNCNGSQCGCQLGGGGTWTLNPTYIQGAENSVTTWTNANPACAGTTNTSTQNAPWLAQSIVDQSTGASGAGAVPTFNYPHTSLSGWVCRSVVNTSGYDCAANDNADGTVCPNNSSPQGQIFYANFGPTNMPTPNYGVYAVDQCQHAEGVEEGNAPGYQPSIFNGTISGIDAASDDMVGYANGTQVIPAQCVLHH
jgi:hypothetical protein